MYFLNKLIFFYQSHIADNMGYIRYVTAGIYQMQFYKTLCQLAGELQGTMSAVI